MKELAPNAVPAAPHEDKSNAKVVSRWLMLAAFIASLLVLPYTYSFERQRAQKQATSEILTDLGENVAVEFLLSCFFIIVGLRLRRSLGLDVSLLHDWPPADGEALRRVRNTTILAIVLGLGLGIVLVVVDYFVDPMMPRPRRPLPTPSAWTGLLASVGAGVQEEIWTRLGIMMLLVWVGTRIVRRSPPASAVVWAANFLAALFFGALHLPQAAVLLGPTPIVIAYTLIGNGVPGLVFGWLYWRYGLAAAMLCHFAGDVMLKAIVPLLGIG